MRRQGTLNLQSPLDLLSSRPSQQSFDLLQESEVDLSLILEKPTVFKSFHEQSISGNAKRFWLCMWTYSKAEWVGNSLPGLSWHNHWIYETGTDPSYIQLICVALRSQRYVFHRTQSHGCCTQFWPWICPGSRNSCPTWPTKHARLHRWTLNNATMNGFHSKQSGDVKTCMVCIVLDNHHDDYYMSIHFLDCLLDFSAFSES